MGIKPSLHLASLAASLPLGEVLVAASSQVHARLNVMPPSSV